MPAQLTDDNVFPILFKAVTAQVGSGAALSSSTTLQDDLEMDSLEIVELGVALEKEFALVIPDAELRACVTLEDVARVVLAAGQGQDRE